MKNDIDSLFTKEVVCPYCGHEFSDSWEWDDSEDEIYCDNCDNKFAMERNIEVTYSTYKTT